jgi:hypothetical protein
MIDWKTHFQRVSKQVVQFGTTSEKFMQDLSRESAPKKEISTGMALMPIAIVGGIFIATLAISGPPAVGLDKKTKGKKVSYIEDYDDRPTLREHVKPDFWKKAV